MELWTSPWYPITICYVFTWKLMAQRDETAQSITSHLNFIKNKKNHYHFNERFKVLLLYHLTQLFVCQRIFHKHTRAIDSSPFALSILGSLCSAWTTLAGQHNKYNTTCYHRFSVGIWWFKEMRSGQFIKCEQIIISMIIIIWIHGFC